ncbi:hypothetical protein [Streptomyces sp. NPDC007205]|uniref:hypothetical protein n=1 Tax=Streptomyces sp. NPDC007205 TaxID=3154316 RepID=UPI00340D85BF
MRLDRGAILVVALIVLFTWSCPTTMVVIWTAVLTLLGVAIREFLDTGTATATDPPESSRARGAAP